MPNQSEIAKYELIGNLLALVTSDLNKFVLLLQTSTIEKLNIQILYCCLGHLNFDNIIQLIFMLSGLKMFESMNKFFYKTCLLAK